MLYLGADSNGKQAVNRELPVIAFDSLQVIVPSDFSAIFLQEIVTCEKVLLPYIHIYLY